MFFFVKKDLVSPTAPFSVFAQAEQTWDRISNGRYVPVSKSAVGCNTLKNQQNGPISKFPTFVKNNSFF